MSGLRNHSQARAADARWKVQMFAKQALEAQSKLTAANNYLDEMAKLCDHEFQAAPPGFEHEGGTCIHCGFMELYLRTRGWRPK